MLGAGGFAEWIYTETLNCSNGYGAATYGRFVVPALRLTLIAPCPRLPHGQQGRM
jgi:hypothetical protein